jgi:hypothetical protein
VWAVPIAGRVVLKGYDLTMRRFIITNPNLSVGKPGDEVTAAQLRMTDEKLDEFVAIGYAVEVEAEDAAPEPVSAEAVEAATVDEVEATIAMLDPGEMSAREVIEYAESTPSLAFDLLAAEQAGKARSTVINGLKTLIGE